LSILSGFNHLEGFTRDYSIRLWPFAQKEKPENHSFPNYQSRPDFQSTGRIDKKRGQTASPILSRGSPGNGENNPSPRPGGYAERVLSTKRVELGDLLPVNRI
jgi:hypothetical protein